MSRRIWIPLLLLVVWLGGIEVGRLYSAGKAPVANRASGSLALESGTWLSPPRALPEFQLADQDGQSTGPARFQGHWTLVFLGFTHCPEACPTTLALLATVRRELASLVPADRVPHVLLVSVDPERDTPAILKAYLAAFDPAFTGLTGDPAAVRDFTTALGVPYRKIPAAGDYMVDHGLSILLVNPRGQVAANFSPPHVADVLIRDYRACIANPSPGSRS